MIYVMADSSNTITERSESNNVASIMLQSSVVPEFPQNLVLMTLIVAVMLVAVLAKKKPNQMVLSYKKP